MARWSARTIVESTDHDPSIAPGAFCRSDAGALRRLFPYGGTAATPPSVARAHRSAHAGRRQCGTDVIASAISHAWETSSGLRVGDVDQAGGHHSEPHRSLEWCRFPFCCQAQQSPESYAAEGDSR